MAEMVAMHALLLRFALVPFIASPVYLRQLLDKPLNRQWEAAVIEAIRTGNDFHYELFGGEGIDVAVEDAVSAIGDHCHISGIVEEYNVFGADPLNQFAAVINLILQQKQSFHVLVVNDKTMIIIQGCH